jgi:hypothetical protein
MIQAERGDAQADEAALNLYQLHAVLIHKGDVHSGHYTCCANLGGQWFCFDGKIHSFRLSFFDQFLTVVFALDGKIGCVCRVNSQRLVKE